MRPIACLVSSNVLEGRPEARSDAHEFTRQSAALAPAAQAAGFELVPTVWDEDFDPGRFEAVVIGPTWDYWDKLDAYLTFLDAVSERALLLNPARVVRWNIEKTYLKDLAALGAPVIPTVWADSATQEAIAEGFERFGAETITFEVGDDYPGVVAALQRYDVLLTNPVIDGTNLVAKEGPTLNERDGVLVLSRSAGAAGILADGALLVNPYDVEDTAEALHQALVMDPGERKGRSERLKAGARRGAPADWLDAQRAALRAAVARRRM
jgi:hypothetical protein